MAGFTLVISGKGLVHGTCQGMGDSIDKLKKEFMKKLKEAGHEVDVSILTSGSRDAETVPKHTRD